MMGTAEIERRRRVIAAYNQVKSATYANFADFYRTNYLGGWRRWVWNQKWVREQIADFQMMSEAHALTARLLMGIEP